MSITKRIIDSARSGLNQLLDAVAPGLGEDDTEAAAAKQEIARRAQARAAAGRSPALPQSPLARMAGASPAARRERERAAATREERIRGASARKAADQARAADEDFRRVKERAYQQAPPAGSRASGGGASSGPRRPGPANRSAEGKIAKHYKTLDLPVGSDFVAVKASYRKLMRKYHPDLHGQTADKQRAATELTKQITQAYNELEAHLLGGPNRT